MNTKKLTVFWEKIVDDIHNQLGWAHPGEWSNSDYGKFGNELRKTLLERCTREPALLARCGNGKEGLGGGFSYSTIRRCLNDKAVSTRYHLERFAVFFGYESCGAYCNEKGIDPPIPDHVNEQARNQAGNKRLEEKIARINETSFCEIASFNQRYRIQEIFIDPTFRDEQRRITHNDPGILIAPGEKILVHADGFTGKTTLLRFLALTKDQNIKLYLPLHEYDGSLEDLIQDCYDLTSDEYDLIRRMPHLILLLDAFDEMESEELRLALYRELEDFSGYLLTSRSKHVAGYTDIARQSYSIVDYAREDISLLADRMLGSPRDIVRFFDGFKRARAVTFSDDLLKYPWLIVYMAEYFKDGAELDDFFFLSLPVEVFDSLTDKLIKRRSYPRDQVAPVCSALGKLILDMMRSYGDAPRTIRDGELGARETDLLMHLAEMGALNAVSTLSGKRDFRFNIPFLAEVLAAFYLAGLPEEHLRRAIQEIYYAPVFRQILGYSILMRARQGEVIDLYFEEYGAPPGPRMENVYYRSLVELQLLAYLPQGVFRRRAGFNPGSGREVQYNLVAPPAERLGFILNTLPQAFDDYGQVIDEDAELFEKIFIERSNVQDSDYLAYYYLKQHKVFLEQYFSMVSVIIAKNPEYIRDWDVLLDLFPKYREDTTRFPPNFYELLLVLVPSTGFEKLVIRLMDNPSSGASVLLSALVNSPYRNESLTRTLLRRFSAFRLKMQVEARNTLDTYVTRERWEDYLDELVISILFIKHSADKEEEIIDLLRFYGVLGGADDDEVRFFMSKFGEIKSIRFAEILARFMRGEFDREGLERSVSPAYRLFEPMTMLSAKSERLSGLVHELLDHITADAQSLWEEYAKKMDCSRHSEAVKEKIRLFFANFLSYRPYPPAVPQVEDLLEKLLNMPRELKMLFAQRFILVAGFLVIGESEGLLDLLRTRQPFLQRFLEVFSDRGLPYFKVEELAGTRISDSYLARLAEACLAGEAVNSEDVLAMVENFRNLETLKTEEDLSDDETYFQYLQRLVDEEEWYEFQKSAGEPRFERFLADKTGFKFMKYALYHSILCIKPLFVEPLPWGGYQYRFSMVS